MKKLFAIATATIASAAAATAGSIAYVAPEITRIEEPAPMGGSGIWLIPLIILGVLILSLTGEEPTD
ncbi:MAG: hypothetical protein L3J33_08380 [Rhodobacteraceae bacterium]|nr:hypothetical protein [Paracoccaceae bacterium]